MEEALVSSREHSAPAFAQFQEDLTDAYVGKIGFLWLELSSDLQEGLLNKNSSADLFQRYSRELYKCFSGSPHVMEITPQEEEFNTDLGMAYHFGFSAVTSFQFLKLRVNIPKRKSEEFFKLWPVPEQFVVYFNGAIFLSFAQIKSAPVVTSLGQVTREFLKQTLADSELWKIGDGIGPTPIHPEVYVFRNKSTESKSLATPKCSPCEGSLVLTMTDAITLDDLVNRFLFSDVNALTHFYQARICQQAASLEISKLMGANKTLSSLLAHYFSQSSIRRLLGKNSGQIRRLLGEMHLMLEEIARLELRTENQVQQTKTYIEESRYSNVLSDYFTDRLGSHRTFDLSAQHTLMNFAAEETSNLVVIQATLIAALIGAVLGGLMTVGAQVLLTSK